MDRYSFRAEEDEESKDADTRGDSSPSKEADELNLEEDYDDSWDYLYDDIQWQNQKSKIRKSEKRDNKNNKNDW